jgi:hypothetical protein
MEGEGILRLADGSKFKGQFKKGAKNGPGIMEDKNGNRFEGNFVNDEKDGPFVEKDRNGKITRQGTYSHGVCQTK